MLTLDSEQLAQIRRAAGPIPARLRESYLQRIAELLEGRAVNHATVRQACAQAKSNAAELRRKHWLIRAPRELWRDAGLSPCRRFVAQQTISYLL